MKCSEIVRIIIGVPIILVVGVVAMNVLCGISNPSLGWSESIRGICSNAMHLHNLINNLLT